MYNVGDIFYEDSQYAARAQFCNENNYRIIEIDPDQEGRARFQIQKPEYSQKELNMLEIQKIKEELKTYDYIGVKIAMGVSTKEEYAEQIAYTETLREQIRKLENQ